MNARRKRQIREQEELAALSAAAPAAPASDEDEEDIEEVAQPSKAFNAFAALGAGDEGGAEEEEEEEEEEQQIQAAKSKKSKSKKKKKKSKAASATSPVPATPLASAPAVDAAAEAAAPPEPSPAPAAAPPPVEPPAEPTPKATKTALKKAKLAKRKAKGLDELERALQELSVKYPDMQAQAEAAARGADGEASGKGSNAALRSLLSIDPKHLDPAVELRKLFGSRVVASASASTASSSSRGGSSRRPLARQYLAHPKATWAPAAHARSGLGMEELPEDEVREWEARHGLQGKDVQMGGSGAGGRGGWWTFVHDMGYRQVEAQFLQCVGSFDPNTLMALLQVYPYHTDTLLQLSEVAKQQGDLSMSGDFVERALFAYERAFAITFNVTSGACRLDFDRIENRPLWLAIHRNVQYLTKRGCWRTAFEFSKLLLSLDPLTDPHGALLWLDFLAVKTRQFQWLVDLVRDWPWRPNADNPSQRGTDGPQWMENLPGMWWSRALAIWWIEEGEGKKEYEGAKEALKDAILRFPQILPLLADKLSISLDNDLLSQPAFNIHPPSQSTDPFLPIHLLSHLYVDRSLPIWKDPSIPLSTLLPSALSLAHPSLPSKPAFTPAQKATYSSGVPHSHARHLIVADVPLLLAFLPLAQRGQTGDAYDPLPPKTGVSAYGEEYFSGVRMRSDGPGAAAGRRGRAVELLDLLGMLMRGEVGMEQLQGLDEGTRNMIAEQVQHLHNLERANADGQPPGAFPGGAPVDVENDPAAPAIVADEAFSTDEEEDDDEEARGVLGQVIGALGRMWGAAGRDEDEDEEGSAEEWDDEEGVDGRSEGE